MKRLLIFIAGILLMMMVGCKGTREIVREVPVYMHDTTHETHTEYIYQRDTIINNTETIVREANAGDSVLLAKLGIQLKDNEHTILVLRNELLEKIQQLEQAKNDSTVHNNETPVAVKETEYIEVKKPLGRWQKLFMGIGIIGVIGLIVYIIYKSKNWWIEIIKKIIHK